eukprot:GFUD01135663.1.p1 GENE.GFUD01135663.1~~GFUD01135663.1.p1  ORF type:complete len:225 (-),score=42.44 GFUD01135663.1:212-886(-)
MTNFKLIKLGASSTTVRLAPGKLLKKIVDKMRNYMNKMSSCYIIKILVEYIFSLYHAGVAAKMRMVVHLVINFSSLFFLTECIVRSLGLTATSTFKASSVQGVHHAGVAVREMHIKVKCKDLVYIFGKYLVYPFSKSLVYSFIHRLVIITKIKRQDCAYMKQQFNSIFKKQFTVFNFMLFLTLSECILENSVLITTSTFNASSARVVHHAGVAWQSRWGFGSLR